MALDGTAKEFFFRSSIKKYFIDNLKTIENKVIVFDKTILYEEVREYVKDEWIVINFGIFNRDLLSENILDIYCCTRQDPEGVLLSKLTDLVVEYLTDITQTDTMKRITLYNSTDNDPLNWTEIGKLLVTKIFEGSQNYAPDATKVKMLTVLLSWASKI